MTVPKSSLNCADQVPAVKDGGSKNVPVEACVPAGNFLPCENNLPTNHFKEKTGLPSTSDP